MPPDRTVVTELATALGTLPCPDLASAIAARPPQLRISSAVWDHLDALFGGSAGSYAADFAVAYANGQAFAATPDALAGRPPRIIEWTGGRKPPGDEVAPIDLRIDHVYMVSCKYLSANVANPSPARLCHGLLATGSWASTDWYHAVAPAEYQALYDATVRSVGIAGLPDDVELLTTTDRRRLRAAIRAATRDGDVERAYLRMSAVVARESANRWRERMENVSRDLMLWRLLRIGNAPYFLLGSHDTRSLRLRVATAWDWRDRFEVRDLSIEAALAGQPKVEWAARYRSRATRETRTVRGHVEIRWSHGRFAQPPEAKIYLDTPIEQVPGYHVLGGAPGKLFTPCDGA